MSRLLITNIDPQWRPMPVIGHWAQTSKSHVLSVRLIAPPAKTKAAKNLILNKAALELGRLETKARPSKGSCQLLSDSAAGS